MLATLLLNETAPIFFVIFLLVIPFYVGLLAFLALPRSWPIRAIGFLLAGVLAIKGLLVDNTSVMDSASDVPIIFFFLPLFVGVCNAMFRSSKQSNT